MPPICRLLHKIPYSGGADFELPASQRGEDHLYDYHFHITQKIQTVYQCATIVLSLSGLMNPSSKFLKHGWKLVLMEVFVTSRIGGSSTSAVRPELEEWC